MEVFGIGPMELILLLIVALAVFGPDKLPQIGAKLGRAMRDMRKATRAISEEINSTRAAIEAPARELAEPFKDVTDAAKAAGSVAAAVRNPGQAMRDSVIRELNAPARPEAGDAAPAAPENTIAPPAAAAALAAANTPAPVEAVPALPEPTEPVPALPEPAEPVAALPEPAEPVPALPAPGDLTAASPAAEDDGEERPAGQDHAAAPGEQ